MSFFRWLLAEQPVQSGLLPDDPPLRLVRTVQPPSRDEFQAWRDDPTTRAIFSALAQASAIQRDAWIEESWHKGEADLQLLTELRTRADAYEALEAIQYDALCEWLGVEPEQEEQAA